VTIKNNLISSPSKSTYNLVVEQFTDPTVSGNVVNGGLVGIYVDAQGIDYEQLALRQSIWNYLYDRGGSRNCSPK
jgi:hypothetical protein